MYDLQPFADNLWIVDGPLVRDTGIWFTTRMAIIKLSNGSLWVNSPVPVPSESLEQIKKLGPVKYLVAATPRHVWRLEKWHSLFPDAELWVTPQINNRFKIMMVMPLDKLPHAGILDETPPRAWANDLGQLVFRGSYFIKEVLFFHKASRTVILDDLIQSHKLVRGNFIHNALIRFGGVRPPGGVARDIRLTFINRRLARQSLEMLLSWDFDRLIIAHGPCVETGAKQLVERAFQWLQH